jgi:signal transduction histidine kinase
LTTEHLRFAPSILVRLGEELIPHPDQGVIELARNSYDADARTCRVELTSAGRGGGTLRVSDDGIGMTRDEIERGFLVLGRSLKTRSRRTPGGRLQVGDKGLGRLAAMRLGDAATVRTRPKAEPGVEYAITFDWTAFEYADTVESVPIDVRRSQTGASQGTDIEVSGLRARFGRREVQRLARGLLLLADPFAHERGFRPTLSGTEFRDLEKRVRVGYLNQADLRLTAEVKRGRASARVVDQSGRKRWTAVHADLTPSDDKFECPDAKLDVWIFLRAATRFAPRTDVRVGELRAWLDTVGGVHLYRRGLRVSPYGDAGQDWLDMNLARVRDPELRPATNTVVGRVIVDDAGDALIEKTDRTGFIENDSFLELRRFAVAALDWLARERVAERERLRRAERATVTKGATTAKRRVKEAIEVVPKSQRKELSAAVQSLERAHERESEALRQDLQLYRTLGTVGATVAVFGHEAAKPASQIAEIGKSLRSRVSRLLSDAFEGALAQRFDLLLRYAARLQSFSALPVRLLERPKRQWRELELNAAVSDAADLFRPFLNEAGVELRLELADSPLRMRGSVAAIESILTNFVLNSIAALRPTPDSKPQERLIVVRTDRTRNQILLRVLDSGKGISGIRLDDIWLPGQTTTNGTGLGLTIVRDTVSDLGGSVQAVVHGELGGAEFIVTLPGVEE